MNKTEEKIIIKKNRESGVTLVALVTTIVILLILASVGATSGIQTINSSKFINFKNELTIIQSKVNELNQANKTNIGQELNEQQKQILNYTEVSNIIYSNKTEQEKQEIENGFRYVSKDVIKNEFNLESVKSNYLINIQYRYVVCYEGFEYNNITYYMIEQTEDGIYNVEYTDKNSVTGDFEVNAIQEGNRWKIEISNINYDGYINNWQVKYRLDGEESWKTANGLSFYVTKKGNYYVNVSFGDNIDLGTQLVSIVEESNEIYENNIIL